MNFLEAMGWGLPGAQDGQGLGGLEGLLQRGRTAMHDSMMPMMYGDQPTLGKGIYQDDDDYWKEYLQRMMWKHINSQPRNPYVQGQMPSQQRGQLRPPQPMGILGYRG